MVEEWREKKWLRRLVSWPRSFSTIFQGDVFSEIILDGSLDLVFNKWRLVGWSIDYKI